MVGKRSGEAVRAGEENKKTCACCHNEFSAKTTHCPHDGTTLTAFRSGNLVGTSFAEKYDILEVIGMGGMGVVYKARHRFMNRIVAIKVLHHSNIDGGEALKRFRVEAEAASKLSIPNVVTIYDFGVSSDGEPYMVMDYLQGDSLKSVLDAEGALAMPRALSIFVQICYALAHAHSKGIIHRDLTPANVLLVDNEGQSDFVKVLDFGIAKLLYPSESTPSELTKTGEIFGSPLYMSPEQWRGQKLDGRSDIYALGSIMYRTLTGQPLFQSSDVVEIMYKQISETPATFAQAGVSLPSQLEAIVLKALEKDRSARYQSMLELMEALQQFAGDTKTRVDHTAAYMLSATVAPSQAPEGKSDPAQSASARRSPGSGNQLSTGEVQTQPAGGKNRKIELSIKWKTLTAGAILSAAAASALASFLFGHGSPKQRPPLSPIYVTPISEHRAPAATGKGNIERLDQPTVEPSGKQPGWDGVQPASSSAKAASSMPRAAPDGEQPEAGGAHHVPGGLQLDATSPGVSDTAPEQGVPPQPSVSAKHAGKGQKHSHKTKQNQTAATEPKKGGLKNAIKNFFKKF